MQIWSGLMLVNQNADEVKVTNVIGPGIAILYETR